MSSDAHGIREGTDMDEQRMTYEDLEALLKRVEAEPYGWEPEPVHPDVKAYYQRRVLGQTHEEMADVFEDARREGETRAQAKTRIMLEAYSLEGRGIRDSDLWRLRAQYVWVREYVQGVGGGLPYNTHNWAHFYNRYGQGGAREPVLMIGLRKDTVTEMARLCAAESEALRALQILGH